MQQPLRKAPLYTKAYFTFRLHQFTIQVFILGTSFNILLVYLASMAVIGESFQYPSNHPYSWREELGAGEADCESWFSSCDEDFLDD